MTGGRERWRPPPGLVHRSIWIGGAERTFQVAALPARQPAPLLMVLHGLGTTSSHMAMWTGLAVRGPDAGFVTVFPEAWKEMWDEHATAQGGSPGAERACRISNRRPPRRPGWEILVAPDIAPAVTRRCQPACQDP